MRIISLSLLSLLSLVGLSTANFEVPSLHSKRGTDSPVLASEVGKECYDKPNYFLQHTEPAGKLIGRGPGGKKNTPVTGRGQNITVAGVPTYFTKPKKELPGPKKVIMFLSDLFSPFNDSNILVQDEYADAGFHVLGIDYFLGDSGSNRAHLPQSELLAWAAEQRVVAEQLLPKWIRGVKQIYGPTAKYSAVGYCFGAPYALDLAATDEVVAAAFAHPASLTEAHFSRLTKPVLLSCAENDFLFPPKSLTRAEEILASEKKNYHVQIFSGTQHGFAIRANPADPNAVWAKEKSLRSITEWFHRFSQ